MLNFFFFTGQNVVSRRTCCIVSDTTLNLPDICLQFTGDSTHLLPLYCEAQACDLFLCEQDLHESEENTVNLLPKAKVLPTATYIVTGI